MSEKYPPVLLRYLKIFQDDPTSRIFAPLAEAYRKIGLFDEAIEICLEGLTANPDFIGGKVALARAYFDKKMFVQVRDLLTNVVAQAPDNIMAQRLFADSNLALGFVKEALSSYKMLLYLCPYDQDVCAIVQDLETQSYEGGGLIKGGIITAHQKPEKLRKLMKIQKLLNRLQELQTRN